MMSMNSCVPSVRTRRRIVPCCVYLIALPSRLRKITGKSIGSLRANSRELQYPRSEICCGGVAEFRAQTRENLLQRKIADHRLDSSLLQSIDVDQGGEHLIHTSHRLFKQRKMRGVFGILEGSRNTDCRLQMVCRGWRRSWLAAARNLDFTSFARTAESRACVSASSNRLRSVMSRTIAIVAGEAPWSWD